MIFLSAVGLMIHSDPSWRLRPTAPSDSSTPPPWWWASSSALLSSFSPRRSTATSPPFPASSPSGSPPASSPSSARWSVPNSPPPSRAPAASTFFSRKPFPPPAASSGAGPCSGAPTRPSSTPQAAMLAMFWSAHSAIIAASGVVLARYVAYFVPLDEVGIRAVAVAAVLTLSFVNYLGVRQGSMLQTTVTITKVIAILVLLGMAAFLGSGHPPGHAHSAVAPPPSPAPVREFVLAVSAALFAFGGWHMVTYTAGETRDPVSTIPRALLIGTLTVTTLYVLLNAAYLYLLPISRVTASPRVAADAAQAVAGPRGASLISALVTLSATGVLNGVILAGPRTYYAMAREGLAFRWLGSLRHAI